MIHHFAWSKLDRGGGGHLASFWHIWQTVVGTTRVKMMTMMEVPMTLNIESCM